MALLLSMVLWGAFGFQFFLHERPCPLCLLQRLGMLGVCFGALMNVRFGIQRFHYGLSLISAIFGGFVALRHITLHICPSFPPSPWKPFFGLNLYTWSFIVFSASILYIAALMLIFSSRQDKGSPMQTKAFAKIAFFSVALVALLNIFTTLHQCGLGNCDL